MGILYDCVYMILPGRFVIELFFAWICGTHHSVAGQPIDSWNVC